MKSQFLRHSLHTYAAQLAQTALAMLIAIGAARLLGPANKGIYSLLVLVPVLLVTLARCGLGPAVNYFCGRRAGSAVIFNGLLLIGVLAVGSLLLALPAVILLRRTLLRHVAPPMLLWMTGMIPVFFLFDYFLSSFAALMQVKRRNLLLLAYPACQLVLMMVMVAWLRWGLAGALLSLSLALVLAIGWSAVVLYREAPPASLRPDKALMGQLLRFGLKSHIGGVMEVMNYRADFFLVNLFLGPAAVGFYSVAVNLGELILRLPDAVVLILIPKLARMEAGQAGVVTPRLCRLILLPVLIFCLGLLVLGRFLIVFFFGPSFFPAAAPLLLLLPGFIAFAVWKILAGDLIARGRPLAYSVTALASFAAMVLLDCWLIPRWGIAGAAMASSSAYMAVTILIVVMYRRLTGIRLRDLFIPRREDFRLLAGTLGLGAAPGAEG